jgi:hypothetical protein
MSRSMSDAELHSFVAGSEGREIISMTAHDGRLFVATREALYELGDDMLLHRIGFAAQMPSLG